MEQQRPCPSNDLIALLLKLPEEIRFLEPHGKVAFVEVVYQETGGDLVQISVKDSRKFHRMRIHQAGGRGLAQTVALAAQLVEHLGFVLRMDAPVKLMIAAPDPADVYQEAAWMGDCAFGSSQ